MKLVRNIHHVKDYSSVGFKVRCKRSKPGDVKCTARWIPINLRLTGIGNREFRVFLRKIVYILLCVYFCLHRNINADDAEIHFLACIRLF